AVDVQVVSFVTDPCMRWMWPDAQVYLQSFPRLAQAFGGGAFPHDGADISDDFRGGALWLPPGVGPDEEALDALMRETVPEPQRSAVMTIREQMGSSPPRETHWHLAMIGVDAAHQGQGVGADVMRHRLAMIDGQGLIAYLESSNTRNIPFYRRHGFEAVGE